MSEETGSFGRPSIDHTSAGRLSFEPTSGLIPSSPPRSMVMLPPLAVLGTSSSLVTQNSSKYTVRPLLLSPE